MISTVSKFAALAASVGIAAALGTATAAAQVPQDVQQSVQPTFGDIQVAGALPQWDVQNGAATATARDAIALAVAQAGGNAMANAAGSSAPAVIAVGDGALAEATGVVPGLALGIAGAYSTVNISGVEMPICTGNFAFAGDFQTLSGCVSINGTNTPLGGSVAVPWGATR